MISREHIKQKAEVMSRTLEGLAPTYTGDERPDLIRRCRDLPSEDEVLRLLALMDDVFYPGYRGNGLREEPVEALVIERLDEVYDVLYRQVKRALPLRWESQFAREQGGSPDLSPDEVAAEAERIVNVFFDRIPAVREMLKLDVVAAYKGDPAARSYDEIILSYPGMRAITKHRIAHELYLLDVPLIPRLMSEYIHNTTSIEIHPGARIGESFFIDHGTGVVIGETALIGDRVKLYQGVTLGAKSFKLDEDGHPVKGGKRHPTIEDDVVIYSGATILGGDTVIGKGAVIGGNVWLIKSVPPNTTVTLSRENYTLRGNSPL
jgi:serine O-acetyltransferase